MHWNILNLLVLIVAVNVCQSDEISKPRLIVSKQLLNKYLVENSDLLVRYNIFNVGNGAASEVKLVDNGFYSEAFEIVGGARQAVIERIPPQSNYTHVLVVRPKSFGYFNFTAAEVTYKHSEDTKKIQYAVTSEPGEGGIVNLNEFNKRFSSHFFDWVAFAIMAVPPLAIPFALWRSSKSKYERSGKHKKH